MAPHQTDPSPPHSVDLKDKHHYAVILKPDADKAKHLAWLNEEFKEKIVVDNKLKWNINNFKGYVVIIDKEGSQAIRNRKDVRIVEEEKTFELETANQ